MEHVCIGQFYFSQVSFSVDGRLAPSGGTNEWVGGMHLVHQL